jgi:hypothetical protein
MSVCLPRPARRRPSATVLLTMLAACSSWQVQPAAPAQLVSESSPSQVRVQLHDGRRLVLRQPTVRADSLIGRGDSTSVAVADIDSIALRRFDTPRTIGLTVLIFAVPAALCAATCEFGPSFGR